MGLTTLWKLRRRAINLLETSVQSHLKLPESKRNLIKCQQSHSCILRHFLNFYSVLSRSVVSDSQRPHGLQPARLACTWDSPGENTGVGCHFLLQCMKVKNESEVAQLCWTLRDPTDCSLPGSSIHGSLQARVLEWVAMSSSRGSSRPGDGTHVSCISCTGRGILSH